ncbi:hypothetical protein MKA43_22700 [[Clostridium] innocuum]|nr:hypothetical protein [[Clostridium] innocuum]MCR0395230.1 hypothetical protein [[Clostridium] innocuum]
MAWLEKEKQGLQTKHCRTAGVRQQQRHDGSAVKGRKCFVCWRTCEPYLCPRYLTGGHYFTKDKSKTVQPQSCKE